MNYENKYAPKNLAEYVWPSKTAKAKVGIYIKNEMDGHLLLHGRYGTGKTTLSKLLSLEIARQTDPTCTEVWNLGIAGHQVNTASLDKLRINACLVQFQLPKQLIVIDEADQMTHKAMDSMKKVMDDTQAFCSFIFCTNYVGKIEGGIHSRCVDICFDSFDENAMIKRAKTILLAEGVELPDEQVKQWVVASNGDYRQLMQSLEIAVFSMDEAA